MAQRVEVKLLCDLDEGEEVPATTSVTFGLDGRMYAFELCEDHLRAFHETMDTWTKMARDVGALGGGTRRAPRPHTEDLSAIRAWARTQGYNISERGRIPSGVRAGFTEAMSGAQLIEEVTADIDARPRRARKKTNA